jgi:hypothetical protein
MDSSTAASTNNNADGGAKAKTAQPRVRINVKTILPEYFIKLPPSEARQHLVKRCQAYDNATDNKALDSSCISLDDDELSEESMVFYIFTYE